MKDTVLIALITFASGFVGAVSGYLTARMSAKEQRKRESQAALFHSRLSAYTAFIEALENWSNDPTVLTKKAYLFRKTTEASLVASEDTWKCMDKVQLYVLRFSEDIPDSIRRQFLMDKSDMIKSMRKDLALQDDKLNSL